MTQNILNAQKENFRSIDLRKKTRWGESVIQALLFIAGILSVFTTLAIVYEIGKEALLFFGNPDVTFAKFLGSTEWQPGIGHFGIWSLAISPALIHDSRVFISQTYVDSPRPNPMHEQVF